MYQIKCDDYILYDPRLDELRVLNPKCKLETNTIGEGSFTILKSHPYYDKLKKLKSIFEIKQNNQVIFRGRMTNDSKDFQNRLSVDLEGVLGFANDSLIEPFNFPADFPDAEQSTNVIEYFFDWILGQHNAQVESWKQLKPGIVTVIDPNNYITRSSSNYSTTWDTLKTKLIDSLGGYLLIRYESDGNYVDYVKDFTLANTQPVTFGKNLLDITSESDANSTYSAILPMGAEMGEGENKQRLTLIDLPDGDLTTDLVKVGKYIYSKSARETYGWICVPPADSVWDDVTIATNLRTKAVEYLSGSAMFFSGTITIKAVDLSFTDDQIQSFRVGRNVMVNSPQHGVSDEVYQLTKLDIDIFNPQNTTITIGKSIRTLVDINKQQQDTTIGRIENAEKDINENRAEVSYIKDQMIIQSTQIINDCERIIMSALDSYVETSNYEEFKQTVTSQLSVMADEIAMNFTTTTEQITDVNGDLQEKFTQLYKFIKFSGETAITIGSGDSLITLEIDNETGIVFKKNGVQFGHWDGENFYTGNIIIAVNERAQFGNFAFVPRTDGSLSFLKVGG